MLAQNGSVASQFDNLPMENLIGGPLQAAATAQGTLANITSDFINNVGIGVVVFIVTLFLSIVLGRSLGRTVKWTGLGSVDKSFGILFGLFKGYVVAVCFFCLLNWFYSYEKWGISTTSAFSFNVIKKGSDLLIEEFPNYKDIINTKEEIEKI